MKYHQCTMSALISKIFCHIFCTVGKSGDCQPSLVLSMLCAINLQHEKYNRLSNVHILKPACQTGITCFKHDSGSHYKKNQVGYTPM